MTRETYKVVRVKWHDAFFDQGWHSLEDVAKDVTPRHVISIGLLIESASSIKLAQTFDCYDIDDYNKSVSDVIIIPKPMVISLDVLFEHSFEEYSDIASKDASPMSD
jgi:hypothetical protein